MSLIHHSEGDPASIHPGIDGNAGMKSVIFLAMTSMLKDQGLSGGDILNMCLNAIQTGNTVDPKKWMVTQEMVELAKAKAKTDTRGRKGRARGGLGL